MCGIVGKYYFNLHQYNVSDLPGMMKIISHRGPDSSGTFKDGVVAIGFQRLSIIDVNTGNQPLYNETGKIVLVANGEIYNFKELRATLQSSGHIFRTKTDCEVILHLYEEHGSGFVEKLNNMFAFCLYDSEKTVLTSRIGDGAVIGTCVLITKDVPPNMMAKGMPSKFYEMDEKKY
ncbi:MAG: hypothetical protein APR62_07145 [Smithella sp. SDB]|nr:MAG: hypothetical protein APR62_07145 [Smithella sp. SDB]